MKNFSNLLERHILGEELYVYKLVQSVVPFDFYLRLSKIEVRKIIAPADLVENPLYNGISDQESYWFLGNLEKLVINVHNQHRHSVDHSQGVRYFSDIEAVEDAVDRLRKSAQRELQNIDVLVRTAKNLEVQDAE